jgi:aminoglycoside/choline kinase family phosphotransferase
MQNRQNALNNWLSQHLQNKAYTLAPLAGDASFRRYFRLHQGTNSFVVMDAPPEKESIAAFLHIASQLAAHGVHSPAIHAVDEQQGFIVLEDLGDQLLLQALAQYPAETLYTAAIQSLLRLQTCPLPAQAFNKAFMLQEIALFQQWFLEAYLGFYPSQQEQTMLQEHWHRLCDEISNQAQVFIHRDYHSRNLMVLEPPTVEEKRDVTIAVIDFQDAMRGPLTYDLVSLLKDCYIQWPREQILHWLKLYYDQMPLAQAYSLEQFIKAFDFCGLQRHLKVLGIFCRLHLRDQKSSYLRDLPLTFHYVRACLETYPELAVLERWIRERIEPLFVEKLS